jgi:glycosyltransferase involved in cell wall biosynthesis
MPAYNEEKRIESVLKNFNASLIKKFKDNLAILVVSESMDQTNEIVTRYARRHRGIKLLAMKGGKKGKGGAITTGFRAACQSSKGTDVIGFADADLSISGTEIIKLIETLQKENVDGVIASRYVKGSRIANKQKFSRFIASRSYNVLIRMLFGLKFNDTQCGAKFFKASALCGLVQRLALTDMSFDIDLLYEMQKHGFKIVEVPIVYKPIYDYSKLRISRQAPQMLMVALGFRLKHSRFDKYIPTSVKGFVYGSLKKW